MTEADVPGTGWRRSSYSGTNGECVETATSDHAVIVRDSKDPDGTRLVFGVNAWRVFATTLKADIGAPPYMARVPMTPEDVAAWYAEHSQAASGAGDNA